MSKSPTGSSMGYFKALQTVISVAFLMATLFTLWTPASLFTNTLSEKMKLALASDNENLPANTTPTVMAEQRIGIVSGHWEYDSGAVCQDGLTEAEVNLKIATLVKQKLTQSGYTVDLLQEFDQRLENYQGLALVSIHNDSCDYINDEASGFKVTGGQINAFPEETKKLTDCLIDRYHTITGMTFHYNSITPDMTEYHAFNEINFNTTAAIIETGFLNLDREILTEQTDLVAEGVTAGILCYVRNETISATPTPASP